MSKRQQNQSTNDKAPKRTKSELKKDEHNKVITEYCALLAAVNLFKEKQRSVDALSQYSMACQTQITKIHNQIENFKAKHSEDLLCFPLQSDLALIHSLGQSVNSQTLAALDDIETNKNKSRTLFFGYLIGSASPEKKGAKPYTTQAGFDFDDEHDENYNYTQRMPTSPSFFQEAKQALAEKTATTEISTTASQSETSTNSLGLMVR